MSGLTDPLRLLTPDEVAGLLGVSTSWLRRSPIIKTKVGSLTRYRREDVESYIVKVAAPPAELRTTNRRSRRSQAAS